MKNRPSEHISPPGLKGKAAPSGRLWFHTLATLILLLLFGTTTASAQETDYSGVYYIASRDYNPASTTTTNYYLCPTEDWYYYQSTTPFYTNTNNGQPFITTYQCRNGVYSAINAIWIVKKLSNGYYHIIRVIDGKYLTYNAKMASGNEGRMRLHLENNADGDNALFQINRVSGEGSSTIYDIITKNVTNNYKYLNLTGAQGKTGNLPSLQATNARNDGPGKMYVGGILGLWTSGSSSDNNSKWYLESALFSPPTITYNYSQENDNYIVTIADNNSLPAGYDILYTTNGDTPAISGATTSTYSESITITDNCTIKAVVARYGAILTEVATRFIGRPDAPTITPPSDCNNMVEMSAQDGTIIYYTLDGTNPTNNSTQYTGPFALNEVATIKAIAHDGITPSYISTYNFTSPSTVKPTITQNGATITITGEGSIYYTTDGSEPSTNSTPYVDSFTLSGSNGQAITIKAVAKDGSKGLSCVTERTVTWGFFINDLTSLQAVSSHLGELCILTADIDASNLSASISGFTGVFDGDFHTISGLTKPLFSNLNGATVKNVILDNVNISGGTNAGAICSEATGSTRIYNCGVLATTGSTVSGSGHVGGIVGSLSGNARVINCYSYANVSGGSYTAGIVGYNSVETTQNNVGTAGIVMNCMFYGDITGGSNISPVYGGKKINNAGTTGVNNYNYYRRNRYDRETDSYVDDVTFDNNLELEDYHLSWPADAKYLTRFEYYRSILNSNRRLCTWWINGTIGTAPTDQDIEDVGIAKWVLDPSIAPYPILKKWGKYPSVINQDPDKRFNPSTKAWENRADASANWGKDMAPDMEGQKLGTVIVTIKGGDYHSGSTIRSINITAMDTLYNDYCYGKIQLPYYNEIFGNPNGDTWEAKYGNNYTAHVVTGWDISGGNVATGYNFADRNSYSGRVYAQGGYFYVPEGVTSITITAHWANAVYLCNKDFSIDRVNVATGGKKGNNQRSVPEYGSPFTPAGTIPNTLQGQTVYTTIQEAIDHLSTTGSGKDVYNQAIVLVGNVQLRNHSSVYGATGDDTKPFTLMSADLDFDNEPDNCLELQFRNDTDRPGVQPIRFDFLPVPELGLAIRTNKLAYAIGIMIPLGHFEITETAFMHTTQFEYDASVERSGKTPVIINGGEHEMFTVRYHDSDRTNYFLIGGNAWIHRFAPGAHPNTGQKPKIYMSPINVIGGEVKELYLSGLYRPELAIPNNQGNPLCYIDGGNIGTVAGAGYDKVDGNVTFIINHSVIGEFYGGGINGTNPIGGNINVTVNNSRVDKYCGGPKVGNMSGKTVTTHATGTTFGVFYGGGNGGNSYYRELQRDGDFASSYIGNNWPNKPNNDNGSSYNWDIFNPLGVKDDGTDNKGYHAEYEFEVFNQSNGLSDDVTKRGFIKWIQFGITTTGNVSNTLENCKVLGNFYGGGNLATVDGDVTSTLTNTQVNGNAFGAGYSAAIPLFQVNDKNQVSFPSMDNAGTITDGYIPYDSRVYEWTNDLDGVSGHDAAYMKAHPTYQKDGKWYCYTWNSLENLGVVTGDVTLNIEGNTLVMGNVTENNLTVQSGGVFGGGDASGVDGSTHVEIDASGQKSGYAYNTYNVFGGGNKADVGGSVTVNMKQGIVDHDIYGGGALAHTNINNSSNTTDNVTEVNLTGGTVKGDVYGGGLGRLAGDNIQAVAASVEGDVTVTLDGTSMQSTSRIFGGNNINGTPLGQITVDIKNTANTGQDYDVAAVFGGGNMAAYTPTVATTPPIVIVEDNSNNSIRDLFGGGNAAAVPATNVTILGGRFDRVFAGGKGHEAVVNGNTVLHLLKGTVTHDVYGGGMEGSVAGSVTVNIGQSDGSTAVNIGNDVYGGGALANTNTANMSIVNGVEAVNLQEGSKETVVNLYPGATIGHDVYGGGLGRKTVFDEDGITVLTPGIAALVYGNVTVTQFGAVLTATYNTSLDVATSGRIFGCNNINGTPKGSVLVNIKKTARGENTGGYDLAAVYGGGNEAEYVPFNSSLQSCDLTTVIVSPDDCDDISIHSVYGGGNAASTPATNVIINGAHEIKYVFGGGNGAGQGNPGANVGYHDYSDSQFTGTSQEDINGRKESFAYGTGVASTNVYGGHIHFVYGGSNTLGNIREASVAMLDELSRCELHVDGIYGGGREAYMEGKTSVEMGCITGMTAIYGGSENADVGSDVHLNITSGHFDKVFGGNNKGGRIFGSITVNIEQTGCVPITIGELYLGGNNAPYSVFGYGDEVPNQNVGTEQEPEYVTHYRPNEDDGTHQQLYDDPVLHIRSFESIGTVFGGGNGKLATMVADPTVEINVTDGWVNGQYSGGKDEYSQYIGSPMMLDANGVINTVYGGGNEATVIGNTNVLIGDSLNSDATITSMSELFNKVGNEGMKRSNIMMTKTTQDNVKTITYTVVDQDNNPVEGKDPLVVNIKQKVNGVTITGNVYGGGNQADVTDSATIQLGPNP